MGHHWSDGYSASQLAERDAQIEAGIRERKAQEALKPLGEFLLDNPDALAKLTALLSNPQTEVSDL
jgi:hypothetical protein